MPGRIAHTAEVARQAGLRLRTVYFGGGTPTSITAEQLKKLTDCVAEHFDLSEVWEYTIEAGRPDTITREKLQVIPGRRGDPHQHQSPDLQR